MAPFIVLCVCFLLLRGGGYLFIPMLDHWHPALQGAVSIMFLMTASAHWGRRRADLLRMVPPRLPNKEGVVTWTGYMEIAGALGLLVPYIDWAASGGLILMLIMMFPANIHAAHEKLTINGRPVLSVFPRLLLQLVFITAVVLASPLFG